MDLKDKLPEMSDSELKNLVANAERLEKSGSERQQRDASALLPLVSAEIEARREAKATEAKAVRAARPARVRAAPKGAAVTKPAAKADKASAKPSSKAAV